MKLAVTFLLLLSLGYSTQSVAKELGLPIVKPHSVGLSAQRLNKYAQHLQQQIRDQRIAGAVVAVARKGKLGYIKPIGWANKEKNQKMAADTIFRIHSMTKPIASVAVMMLMEDGKLKLRDPVAKYLPELASMKVFAGGSAEAPELADVAQPMTIQHLLSHTAGFAGMGYDNHPVGEMYAQAAPYSNNPTLETFVSRVAGIPLVRQPGEEFIYGPSTDLLARIVEVASGQEFGAFLQDRILDPLQMKDTHFILPAHKRKRFAVAYEDDPEATGLLPVTREEHEQRWKPGYKFRSGGGGLVSTTADYLRFAQMLLNRGELEGERMLAPKTLDLMTLPVVHQQDSAFLQVATKGYGFGLGFAVLQDVSLSGQPGTVGQYFWAGAADTYFFVDPAEELIAVFMTQRYPAGILQLREEFQSFVYQALVN